MGLKLTHRALVRGGTSFLGQREVELCFRVRPIFLLGS